MAGSIASHPSPNGLATSKAAPPKRKASDTAQTIRVWVMAGMTVSFEPSVWTSSLRRESALGGFEKDSSATSDCCDKYTRTFTFSLETGEAADQERTHT
jgi:hypothetical protein